MHSHSQVVMQPLDAMDMGKIVWNHSQTGRRKRNYGALGPVNQFVCKIYEKKIKLFQTSMDQATSYIIVQLRETCDLRIQRSTCFSNLKYTCAYDFDIIDCCNLITQYFCQMHMPSCILHTQNTFIDLMPSSN